MTIKPRAFLLSLAAVLLPTAAFAQSAEDFADKFSAAFDDSGYQIQLGLGEVSGDTYKFSQITLEGPAFDGGVATLTTGVTFEGVEARTDGSYFAATMHIDDVHVAGPRSGVKVSGVFGSGIYIPADSSAQVYMDSAAIGPILFTDGGKEVAGVASIKAHARADGDPLKADRIQTVTTMTGLHLDLGAIVGPGDTLDILKALGLEEINGSMTQDVEWTRSTGRLLANQGEIVLVGLGKLNVTFDLEGYTPDALLALSQLNAEATPSDPETQAAYAELLGNIKLRSFLLRYDETSLVGKALAMLAAQQDLERDEFVGSVTSLLPALLTSQIQDPKLVATLAQPLAAFLREPKSLAIGLAPSTPISFVDLFGVAETPADLVERLGMLVSANQ